METIRTTAPDAPTHALVEAPIPALFNHRPDWSGSTTEVDHWQYAWSFGGLDLSEDAPISTLRARRLRAEIQGRITEAVEITSVGVLGGCDQHYAGTMILPLSHDRFEEILVSLEGEARELDPGAVAFCALFGPCRDRLVVSSDASGTYQPTHSYTYPDDSQ
ncbi:hypothetical protein [Actinokineospora sp.]|uniref:hypothetical protein n=1 Tax=Actinokineospora sp. TaxID=1872133 RepID=UPI0040382454